MPDATLVADDAAADESAPAKPDVGSDLGASGSGLAPSADTDLGIAAGVADAANDGSVGLDIGAPTSIQLVAGGLSFVGLPGVSADGMHLALPDRSAGRIAIDVTRLDGVVLVDKVLREAREETLAVTTLQRRFKARIAQAHKVLAKAGMHALTATTFEPRENDYAVKVPGTPEVIVPKAALDLPCGRASGVDAAYFDREHGLVVLSVVREGVCTSEKQRHDWHVVTFEAGAVRP